MGRQRDAQHGETTGGPAPRTRGPYAKTPERRRAIAEAARAVVLEKGHRSLTTAEVAQRAGMSERAMLYHFPSREHLLVAALELDEQVSTESSPLPGFTDPEGLLAAVPGVHARRGMEQPEMMRLFSYLESAAQDPDHPAHDYMRRHNVTAVDAFANLMRARQAEGTAHPDIDPQVAARHLLGVWNGLQGQWLIEPSFDLADEVTQAFRRLTGQPTMEARALVGEVLTRL